MTAKKGLNRREFIGVAATAATVSLLPRHVLGGKGYVPPSDKITLANIGCGTQGLRELPDMLQHPHIQVVAVCDPNKFSTDYLDWSPHGIRNSIRNTLDNPEWGADWDGIAGGRDVAQAFVEQYYARHKPEGTYKGCKAYEDFRELLAKERDLDMIKIMTPDHLHATIAIAAMQGGKHVITHKPIANRMDEGRKTIAQARESKVKTHLLAWSERPEYALIKQWIDDGVIGTLKEIHNWSYRPVWPQWHTMPTDTPPIPKDFNWDLWLGPVPDRPYHPHFTHNVFRGWYDFGGGSIADMGHYSLFPLFRTLGINTAPLSAKAYATSHRTTVNQVCRALPNNHSFPYSCMIRFKFPAQESLPAFDLFWYDGGMKPFAPEELEVDGKDIPAEGMMFVGDKGKILGGFRGENPMIIPEAKREAYAGNKTAPEVENRFSDNIWIDAIRNDQESPGSFLYAGPVTETINLGAIALRAGRTVVYDAENMKITNYKKANQYLTRKYRKGWEL